MPRTPSQTLARLATHPCAIFALAALCAAYNASSALSHPILHCEDGSVLLSRFYAGHPERILDPYAGYRSLVPQSLGYLASRAAARALPASFAWTAFAVTLATLAVVQRSMPTRRAGALACVAIACAPIANFALVTSVTYSMCHLLLCLLLLVAASSPGHLVRSAGLLALCAALAGSHPLALVAAPVALRRYWLDARDWRGRGYFVALAAICCAGSWWSVSAGAGADLDVLRATRRLAPYVSERVVAEAILGPDVRLWIRRELGALPFHLLAALSLLTLAQLCWSRRNKLARSERHLAENLCLMLVLVSVAALGVSSRDVSAADVFGQRYCYVQRCLFFCVVAILLPRGALAQALFVVATTLLLPLWLGSGRWLYQVDRAEARRVEQHMRAIEDFENERLRATQRLTISRREWPIVIERRGR